MGSESTGGAYESRGKWFARVSVAPKQRKSVLLPSITSEGDARVRASSMNGLVRQLRDAKRNEYIEKVVEQAAIAGSKAMADLVGIVAGICAGTEKPKAKRVSLSDIPTFKSVAELWTGGDLHRDFPDHVKTKKTADVDLQRLKGTIFPLVGHVPIVSFTLADAERVMRELPLTPSKRPLKPATRRQYAQLLHRVLKLAVYPLGLIPHNPLPEGFLPHPGEPPAFTYLHPKEDADLLKCAAVPLLRRLLYGMLAREGMRADEARALTWASLDLETGTLDLDENKTDDPRTWVLDAGVAEALRRWKKITLFAKPTDYVFTQEDGRTVNVGRLAEQLRADLETAKLTRAALFNRTDKRSWLRVHDLRGTFVTLALANGKTEAWVMDRTGHTTSQMLNRYRRAARSVAELELGTLSPLNDALPELQSPSPTPVSPPGGGEGAADPERTAESSELSTEKCTGGESNPYLFRGRNLNPLRLPVSPPVRCLVDDTRGAFSGRDCRRGASSPRASRPFTLRAATSAVSGAAGSARWPRPLSEG